MKNYEKIHADTSEPTLPMYKVSLPNSSYIKRYKKEKILANLND